jgi:uncharacterized protein YoxC
MTNASSLLVLLGVILAAAVVGALVPALVQLRRTLKKAEETLDSTGPRLNRVLDELAITTSRVNQLGPELSDHKERIKDLLDAITDLSQPLRLARASLGRTAMVIGAVGPAVAAAVKAFLTREETSTASAPAARPRTRRPAPADKPPLSETTRNAD